MNNENQQTTNESDYTMETMSELYNIKEITYGTFPLSFNIIDFFHREDPLPMEILTEKKSKGLFFWRPEYYKTCNVQI